MRRPKDIKGRIKGCVKRIVAIPHVFMENISAVLNAAEKKFETLKIETARQGEGSGDVLQCTV